MKKLNRKTIITLVILVVLFVFIITIGVLVYRNRNTLLAIYYTYTNQTAKLEQKKLDTDKRAIEAIKEFGIEDVRTLTDEETEMLNKGELTEEQAVDIVLGRAEVVKETEETSDSSGSQQGEKKGQSGKGSQASNGSGTKTEVRVEPKPEANNSAVSDANKAKNDEIAQLIGKMYVLKAKFSSDLSAIEDWVNSEYRKYMKEYNRNIPSDIKMKVGKKAYADALALEEDCDAQVAAILDRLRVLLTETGQDVKLVDEIKVAYDNEKMLAKSYYMDQV